MAIIPNDIKEKLLKMHYGISGHSAIEICTWTKKHMRDEGACYKRKFYGVDTNRCAEIAPTPIWCEHNCIYCWRPMELMHFKLDNDVMDPQEIIDGLIKERRRLISGFRGFEGIDKEKFEDSYKLFPSHWAISLAGEPTMYPRLGELIRLLKDNKEVKSIFVVTNGEEPESLEKMNVNDNLPVQLYVSVNAPNEDLYKKIAHPVYEDGWQRLNKTLSILKDLKTRTVIRFTMIKGINDSKDLLNQYSTLFESTQSDFIEVKAYMFVGYSRERLKIENMPTHQEVMEFAKLLEKSLPSYRIISEHKPSRIVLLKNVSSKVPNIIIFNDDEKFDKVDSITPDWKIYTLLKKYRKTRFVFDKYGFDSWGKDYMTIGEQAAELGIDVDRVVKDINELIKKEYLK